jgi:hypothetical protein
MADPLAGTTAEVGFASSADTAALENAIARAETQKTLSDIDTLALYWTVTWIMLTRGFGG